MPGLNKVQLIGYLAADPEERFTPSGTKVTKIRLGVTRRWKNSEGEKQEATEWINVEAWRGLADVINKYLKKGSLVYIEGRLQTDRYESDGETRYYTKVVASGMEMLDRKPDEGESYAVSEDGEEYPF